MNEQKHIINWQVLELTVPERGRIQYIQNKTSEIVRQKLHPALDEVFSKLVDQDEIIRIDKLVIELGTIAENDLENEFVERSVRVIKDKINELIILGAKTTQQIPVNGSHKETTDNIKVLSKSKDVLDQFVFFLQSGHFPWWHIPSDSNELENIFAKVLKYETEVLKNAIIPLFGRSSVRQRLVFQFNQSQLDALLKKLNENLFKSYSAQFQDLLSFAGSAPLKKTLTKNFYEIVLQYYSKELELNTEDQKIDIVKDILDLVLSKLSNGEKETVLTEILDSAQLKQQKAASRDTLLIMVAVIQIAKDLPSPDQPLREIIQNLSDNNETLINNLVERFTKKIENEAVQKKKVKKEQLSKGTEKLFSEGEQAAKEENGDKTFSLFPPKPSSGAEEIVISNAGLVLIHPFLKYFFEGLNLLDKELRFRSQSDAFKAIHLLQFIVIGNEIAPETDLPLNKILCGVDITEPVPKSVPLSKEEKEECIYLIKTVLGRWEALKTTNPATLRETYLQREGILKQDGQSWNLTIERNTFDIMLEKLPWSISLIKLPWSPQILYVEW